jgi:hypothetical protein
VKKSKVPSRWTGTCKCGGRLKPVGKGHRNKNYAWCMRCGCTVVADEPDLTVKEIIADVMKEGIKLAQNYKSRR